MPRPPAYKIGNDKVVGTTTPINMWDSGGKVNNLMDWSARLATNYEIIDGVLWHNPIYWRKARDGRGDVGTLTHAKYLYWIDPTQEEPDDSLYTLEQIKEADYLTGLLKDWTHKNPIAPLAVELAMVSREHRYGGTPDIIDVNNVIDVKTGFVNEFSCMLQCASYANLAIENDLTRDQLGGIILQPYEGQVRVYKFSPKTLAMYFPTFLNLLQTYKDGKQFEYFRKKNR